LRAPSFAPSGWYLDGVSQITWSDLKGKAVDVRPGLRSNGTDITVSLEGGYPFDIGDGYRLEPQAQLVYQAISLDRARDPVASIGFANTDSLVGRIGARLDHSWSLEAADHPLLLTGWLRPSLDYEFEGAPITTFSSADGPVPFRADSGKAWVDLSTGADLQITQTAALYASFGYQPAINGHQQAVDAKIGARITW
jgi:outer membrane autotransporter protein